MKATSSFGRLDAAVLSAFTLLYAPRVAHATVTRPFWLDEFFTYYTVTMPDWAGLMDVLRHGGDQNPPLFYALTRLSVWAFGESEWAFRLPAMVGYWAFCASLYILGRLIGGSLAAGVTALATPFVTGAFYYATEARPYGLMLGCFGVGLVCYRLYDLAATPEQRRQAGLGLGGALALGVALHYFAIIPIACLWLAELFRAWRTRQPRWGAGAALVLPAGVLLYNWPLLTEQARIPYWKQSLSWLELPDFYRWMLGTPTCLALLAWVTLFRFLAPRSKRDDASPDERPERDWLPLGIILALMLPVGWMTLMKASGKTMFTPRYLLPAAGGLAILLARAVQSVKMPAARQLALGVGAILVASTLWAVLQPWRMSPPSVLEAVAKLPNPEQKIVVNVLDYFALKHYFAKELPQVTYLYEFMTYRQPADPKRGLRALLQNPRTPPFEDTEAFVTRHNRFYIVCHKFHQGDYIIPRIKQYNFPLARETAEYLVYEYIDE